jgi:1,4-dihydroxy-2-naphthoate octaprenyltransferase
MTSSINTGERSQISLWVQAARLFALPASIVPVLVGALYTLSHHTGHVYWELLPVIVVASVLFHTGTNFVSEYFDFKKGVDREETYGSSRILVDGLMKPKTVLYGGYAAFALGFLLGMILVAIHGLPILILGIVGLLGGIFYTGFPIGYKYYGMGDLLVFLLMGPLMVLGTNLALTGTWNYDLIWVSLPVGFLVAAILNANNIRDIMHDSKAKINTLATLFGINGAKTEYYLLVSGAYISVIVMAILGLVSWVALIVLISLPPAIQNMKMISKARVDQPDLILMGDVKTAQHHLMFGVLYSIGILVGNFVNF